jgi:hypothetical protein
MRRLNPETGKPFKVGDLREDGYIFKSYSPSKIKKDGFVHEDWRSPKAFANYKKDSSIRQAKAALTFKGRGVQILARSRTRAKESGIEHSIVLEDILSGIESGFCELTKLPFDLKPVTKTSQNAYAPSIDRIDSLKGYTKDNIRIVLYSVNAALGQFGTEIMLPILKAMITGIENAQKNTAAPVSEGTHSQGAVGAELRSVPTTGLGKNDNDAHHYSRTVQWQDADYSTQASSGDGVGQRSAKVGTPISPESIEATWPREPKIIWVRKRGGHIPD